jgi:hypothetical protein
MKTILLIFTSLILALFAGCSKENELKKTVFMEDSELNGLPGYSEWGYNTFGAYYDREIFVSNNEAIPAKIVVTNNAMSLIFYGQKGNYYSYADDKMMELTFKLSGFIPAKYSNLTALNDSIFDLKNPANLVQISVDSINYKVDILSGELNFKRAQNLIVDKKQIEVILSGYFEFKALINEKPVTISNGRFDVGISTDNFYNY